MKRDITGELKEKKRQILLVDEFGCTFYKQPKAPTFSFRKKIVIFYSIPFPRNQLIILIILSQFLYWNKKKKRKLPFKWWTKKNQENFLSGTIFSNNNIPIVLDHWPAILSSYLIHFFLSLKFTILAFVFQNI